MQDQLELLFEELLEHESSKAVDLNSTLQEVNQKLLNAWWSVEAVNKEDGGNIQDTWLPVFTDTKNCKTYVDLNDFKDAHELRMTIALALQCERVINNNNNLINTNDLLGLTSSEDKIIQRLSVSQDLHKSWPYSPFWAPALDRRVHQLEKLAKLYRGRKTRPDDIGFIPGNKKDSYAFGLNSIPHTAAEIVDTDSAIRLAEHFPKPNYNKLIADSNLEGEALTSFISSLRFIDWFRSQIRAHIVPRKEFRDQNISLAENYIRLCRLGTALLEELKETPTNDIRDALILCDTPSTEILSDLGKGNDIYDECLVREGIYVRDALRNIESRLDLQSICLYDVKHCGWPSSIPEWHKNYRIIKQDDDRYVIGLRVGVDKPTCDDVSFETRTEAEIEAEKLYNLNLFHIEPDSAEGLGYAIYRKFNNYAVRRIKTGFATNQEATKYLEENLSQVLKHLPSNVVRPEVNIGARVGNKWRAGSVSEEKLKEDFGLDRMVFGNQLTIQQRVDLLDAAYDALADLAHTIGIQKSDIGLNNSLSLSFGARGKGGRGAAAAHYEPDEKVINLTKQKGAGSLCHEWFHALDHFASGGGSAYASNASIKNLEKSNALTKAIGLFMKNLKEVSISGRIDLVNHEINYAASKINRVVNSMTRAFGLLRDSDGPLKEPESWGRFVLKARSLHNSDVSSFSAMTTSLVDEFFDDFNDTFKGVVSEHKDHSISIREKFVNTALTSVTNLKETIDCTPKHFTQPIKSRVLTASKEQDKLDKRNYWSKNIELFARACEAMVKNQMQETDHLSPFLVSYSGGGLYITDKEALSLKSDFESIKNEIQILFYPDKGVKNNIKKQNCDVETSIADPTALAGSIEPDIRKLEKIYEKTVQKRKTKKLDAIRSNLRM